MKERQEKIKRYTDKILLANKLSEFLGKEPVKVDGINRMRASLWKYSK